MRFWDSSAVVPLLLDEPGAPDLGPSVEADPGVVIWWATPVECASAIARREREGSLDMDGANLALARLRTFAAASSEVAPTEAVRLSAHRLLRVHSLRAADALQLAAALAAVEQDAAGAGFVCLDERLRVAASREEFDVLP